MTDGVDLDRRITLQFKADGQSGSGEPTEAWGLPSVVWARVSALSGREYYALLAQQIVAEEMLVFRIRFRPDVRPGTARISQYQGKDYNIRRVVEIGRRGYLDCYADTAVA